MLENLEKFISSFAVWKERKILYFQREIDLLAFVSEFTVSGWRIFCIVGRRLFCIQKAAPPKIPSECETNQLTMHRIQQTTPCLHFKDRLIDQDSWQEPFIENRMYLKTHSLCG